MNAPPPARLRLLACQLHRERAFREWLGHDPRDRLERFAVFSLLHEFIRALDGHCLPRPRVIEGGRR